MTYTLGSLFAGIGGFDLGAERVGFRTLWQSEIEPYPVKVLAKRFPHAEQLGDVTKVRGGDVPAVDVLTFGSPCQDLSVAGLRKGLGGERSGLFFEACRIIRESRPRFAVWENVPGAYSSADGRDFGAALDALADCGALDIAWRCLDAEFFGVAQVRRRVFVVADFGGACAGEVLFEPESGGGHPAPRHQAGQDVAPTLVGGSNSPRSHGKHNGSDRGALIPLAARCVTASGQRLDAETETFVIQNGARPRDYSQGLGIRQGGPMYTLDTFGEHAVGVFPERAHTLRAEGFDASEDGTGRGTPLISFTNRGIALDGAAETLRAASHGALPMVGAFQYKQGAKAGGIGWVDDGSPTLKTHAHGATAALVGMAVRRLMPVECERIQGFPDGWTCLHDHPQQCDCPDGPRYKALGNAVCANVAEWLFRRIAAVLEAEAWAA